VRLSVVINAANEVANRVTVRQSADKGRRRASACASLSKHVL